MKKGTLHKLDNKWIVAWRDSNKSHNTLELHSKFNSTNSTNILCGFLEINSSSLEGQEIYFEEEFLDYDEVKDQWYNKIAMPINIKKLTGHYCYGCNTFFHDTNPDVKEHKGCKGNKRLGICVDSREFELDWKGFIDEIPLRAWHDPNYFLEYVNSKYHPPKKIND